MLIRMSGVFSVMLLASAPASALTLDDCIPLNNDLKAASLEEHLFGGAPDTGDLIVRRGFVLGYDEDRRVPAWAAWRAIKDYRDTPSRKSRWKTFRTDDLVSDVTTDDYIGWFDSDDNFARGHIVPYYISGGDRDHDGEDAEIESTLAVEDDHDACVVFEINSMINIAPQYHDRFNGQPGVWWKLETDVRQMIDDGRSFNVLAGSVFKNDQAIQKIGPINDDTQWDISVPHGYFKIVVDVENLSAVGFLFDHQGDLAKGCDIDQINWPSECVRPINDIEEATGLRFFPNLTNPENELLRATSNKGTWFRWLKAAGVI